VISTTKDCNLPIQHSPVGISSGRTLCSVAIISLILQLNVLHKQLNSCIVYKISPTCFDAHSSILILITSQNHLLIVCLLQWLSYGAWDVSYVEFLRSLQLLKLYWPVVMA